MSSLSIDYSVTETTITLVGTLYTDWGGTDLYVKYKISETGETKDSGTITLGQGDSGSVSAVTFSGLSAGTTYTVYGYIYNNSDAYTGVGTSISVTTASPSVTRPSDWAWTSTIAKGKAVNLTALEWNNFCTRINAFRAYKNMTAYSFTTAVSGSTPISATICNQAWTAINAISGHGTMPSKSVQDGAMYASFFTGLRDALNSIT